MVNEPERHPATTQLLRWFAHHHLRDGQPREIAYLVGELARIVTARLPDGPELTTGLRKLLEAKDCLVRAAIDNPAAPGPATQATAADEGPGEA